MKRNQKTFEQSEAGSQRRWDRARVIGERITTSLRRARTARTATLVPAALAVAFLILGCGKHSGDQASGQAGADQAVLAEQAGGTVQAAPITKPTATERKEESPAVTSADSLPPDVDAFVADTLVAPGAVVEITAEGSADVVELTLSDGIGKPQPFTYDSTADVWRALYRIPVKPSSDRLGLSVTARNGGGHWRRVWIFLTPQQEAPKVEPEQAPGK